ncbi:uncharacterized protein HHUB_2001 [Halobacterium hubeiense]|jgi:hypothetical protein|uniref:Uncharacterized protein n=2 Tax=Halobacterium TaxID=2239 RepID=A0A0U5H5G4_9EURY|nr:hypothetical protein [Halobacterium hubeiense]CQH53748.1 uncharacterized protein HHUB_2001 [Halobacterium hubeiense]
MTGDDRVRERATLDVVEPAIERESVESAGRVGAVAYPYLVYRATATIPRRFLDDRETEYVVSLDRSRRLALRADEHPETEQRTVEDVLVLPAEVSREQAREMARDAVFEWTLRSRSLGGAPDIDLAESVAAHKLFWIADREDGDVLVDSVTGDERPLEG